jgi:hypothetical protein
MLLAVPFLLAGILLSVYMFYRDIGRFNRDMAHTEIPGQLELELKRNEKYTVFLEQSSASNFGANSLAISLSSVMCEIRSLPNGEFIPAIKPSKFLHYSYSNRAGGSFMEVTVPRDGTYLFACRDARQKPGTKLSVAVGAGAAEAITASLGRFFLILIAGIGVALLIFLRVMMLRDQSRKEIRELGLKPV